MSHLNDEQFEELLQGNLSGTEHLEHCPQCQAKLAEQKALAKRLRLAFDGVKSSAGLAEKIREQMEPPNPKAEHKNWRGWSGLAAAVLFFVALPLGWYFMNDSTDHNVYAELSKIHHSNLAGENAFFSNDDPDQLSDYFRKELGFSPQFPTMGHGLGIRGCCVKHFRGQIVGSYVVDTPKGVISVIVVTDTPKSIGMERQKRPNTTKQKFWDGSFAHCNMVTVRLGDYSYCAVGEVTHDDLTVLLERLLP